MIRTYQNGNYSVIIFDDGTKVRHTEDNDFIPSYSECCDVKITDKCSQGCPFCYEGCTKKGKHADLFAYPFIYNLHPYTEMALNGNDLDHPQIEVFLNLLSKQKVFANLTVNQNQFISNYEKIADWSKKKLIHGIGVSLINPTEEFLEKIHTLPNAVLHTINGILTENDLKSLKDKGVKVLILGYKDMRRGSDYKNNNTDIIINNQTWLKNNIKAIIEDKWLRVVSFDNLAIEQLGIKDILSDEQWNECYMGNDGEFTFYIDMVKGEFGLNSMSTKRYKIGERSIDNMFSLIKQNT